MNTTSELIADLKAGKPIILMDDENRENEGDLVIAAEMITPAIVNFMITHARGLLCLLITESLAKQLELTPMVTNNRCRYGTNFTISIEAAEGVTTGISAFDRAKTILTAVKENVQASDFVSPGHIFPIIAKEGGVLTRQGHTEAVCDLARLAGFKPVGALIEIINADGTMARRLDCEKFAKQHNLKMGTIVDLVEYRKQNHL